MPSVFKTVVNVSVWILFAKGVLIAVATLYTAGRAFFDGDTLPMVVVAACAAGSLAFISSCLAVWIRKRIE